MTTPDRIIPDAGLSFGDVDACSSDSELGDIVDGDSVRSGIL